ncbi:MAG TPA: hypothetical protein VN457_01255 [Chlamydiales bacterium]|nr:hypothetical protein [Chlamydiales bacterium]
MKNFITLLLAFFGLFFSATTFLVAGGPVDLVIFSYNRPMQLYALLESCNKNIANINQVHLIYRTSSPSYEAGYKKVFQHFPNLIRHHQSSTPKNDFQPFVLESVFSKSSQAPFVMFAVDDMIMSGGVDLAHCVKALEETNAYAFFLRLGKNIDQCYMTNTSTPVPKGKNLKDDLFFWKFAKSKGDWNYPHSVDMTIYRKKEIHHFLTTVAYTTPNFLEGYWSNQKNHGPCGICYKRSKVVNIPLNLVNAWSNRNLNAYQPADLLRMFQSGLKIDISKYQGLKNRAPHIEQIPTFIPMG